METFYGSRCKLKWKDLEMLNRKRVEKVADLAWIKQRGAYGGDRLIRKKKNVSVDRPENKRCESGWLWKHLVSFRASEWVFLVCSAPFAERRWITPGKGWVIYLFLKSVIPRRWPSRALPGDLWRYSKVIAEHVAGWVGGVLGGWWNADEMSR